MCTILGTDTTPIWYPIGVETIVATTHSDQLVPYVDSEEEYEEEIQDELEYELEEDLEELESYCSEQIIDEDDIDEYYSLIENL
ncbi:hypothetical protein Glove_58g119 [Diversispora epigaea]|uniref:Uncharacterized protein n=1 Tax=Diversispora epigaea TaxID=1348612 RepID=A0A397JC67_9GLOM|nr:hypothetical protein Glove_58g119 [Diversispora epigaea]